MSILKMQMKKEQMNREGSDEVINVDILDASPRPRARSRSMTAAEEKAPILDAEDDDTKEPQREAHHFLVASAAALTAARRLMTKMESANRLSSSTARRQKADDENSDDDDEDALGVTAESNKRWIPSSSSYHVGLGEAGDFKQEMRKGQSEIRRDRTAQLATNTGGSLYTKGTSGVIMPYNRVQWDILLLVLIFIVLLLTPFELSFLSSDLTPREAAVTNAKRRGLFYVNRFIDVCFMIDIVLSFNTAYWKFEQGWITQRPKIAMHYLRTWFFYDLIAVIPYDMIELQVTFVRLIRIFKLLRLLRLVKQPRIMANLAKHITIRRSQQAIIHYIVLLLCLVHWSACLLQIVSSQVLARCDTREARLRYPLEDNTDECPRTFLNYVWNNGVWARYAQAVAWGTATLFGEIIASNNTAETILASAVGLVGVIFISILVGDLANLFSGSDPADNEFTSSFDYLNRYLDSIAMPTIMRKKLREFMLLSEEVFRENYNKSLIHRLSPEMEAILARQSLRALVERVPFYVFALSHGSGLRLNSLVRVWRHHSVDGWMHPAKRRARWARVVCVHSDAAYVTVEYLSYQDDERPSASVILGEKSDADNSNTNKKRRRSTISLKGLSSTTATRKSSSSDDDLPSSHTNGVYFIDDDVTTAPPGGTTTTTRQQQNSTTTENEASSKKKQERVLITRIASQSLETQDHVARHSRLLYERDHFVRDMARLFRLQLYLAYEDVITRDLSMTDSMYAIHAGRIAIFGRSCRHVLRLEMQGLHDVFGEDFTMNLVGSKRKLTRHYAAKTLTNVFVLVLDGNDFFEAIQKSGAKLFYQYCKYYGAWLLLKRSVLAALRANTLKQRMTPSKSREKSVQWQPIRSGSPTLFNQNNNDDAFAETNNSKNDVLQQSLPPFLSDPERSSQPAPRAEDIHDRLSTVLSLEERGLISKEEAADTRSRILSRL